VVTFWAQAADGPSVWWLWVVGGLALWTGIAFVVAVVLGRGIRLADKRSLSAGAGAVITSADVPVGVAARRSTAAPSRRRVVPLPPVGVALVGIAVALETVGYVTRLSGSTGATARMWSMDAPLSIPRMFVAFLFAAGAMAAFAGAGSIPGRRTWWTTVGLVAAVISSVKAGGNIHADAMRLLSRAVGSTGALLVSIAIAAVGLGVLGFLSRAEERDRRRVLTVLGLYSFAAVGLSAVSGWASGAFWTAAATYVEESGEAIAAAAFLVGVLVGVAPRFVLPADWALRRAADAHTLDVVEALPGQASAGGPARS
jgi:hypothetical protein